MIYIHPNTKLLIFDCDGTISDNMVIHNQSWKTVAKRHQLNITTEALSDYNGIPTIDILHKLTQNMDLKKIDLEVIVREKEVLANQKIHLALPIKPIIEIIKHYHNQIPMVVISGGTSDNVLKTLTSLKIKNLFDLIITAEDNHPTKNLPLAFTKIADIFGVNPNTCHVFEDGKLGLINAIKANMMVTDVRVFYS